MKPFLRNIGSVVISKFITVVFSLGTSVIIARSLGPEKNGVIAALLVFPSLFMSIGSLGIRQSTTYLLGKKLFSISDIKTAIFHIWVWSGLISAIISFLLIIYLSNVGDDIVVVILAIVSIPLMLFNTYNAGIYLGENKIFKFNRINWLPPLVTFIFTILFLLIFKLEIKAYFIAIIAGHLFLFGILFFSNNFFSSLVRKPSKIVIRKLLELGLIYAVSLLLITLNYKIDIILLDLMSSSAATGIYSKGAGLAQYLWQIPMVMSAVIFAGSATSKDAQAYSIKVSRLLRISLIVILIVSSLLFVSADFVIELLFGKAFENSAAVLRILLPGVIVLTLFKVLNMDLAGRGKPYISMKAMVPALLINIGLNIYLIPAYHEVGAALASTISYAVAGVIFLFLYSKTIQVKASSVLKFQKNDFKFLYNYLFGS